MSIKIGTRTSKLALWQTNHVIGLLRTARPELICEQVSFVTKGDKTLDKPLPQIGGKGLFTLELEKSLRTGEIDLAVHSLKDLPVDNPAGLIVGAVLERADVRDVLVARQGLMLDKLPPGAVVGTSSLRRRAQLLAVRPDLDVRSIRGNVGTRIDKVMQDDYDAAVLAAAGVMRLGLEAHISHWLPLDLMLPAPGQGAVAVQCREDDLETLWLLGEIDHLGARVCVSAERAFLQELGGGCSVPVAAYAQLSSSITMTALVADPDGHRQIKVEGQGGNPLELGVRMARQAIDRGAQEILSHV